MGPAGPQASRAKHALRARPLCGHRPLANGLLARRGSSAPKLLSFIRSARSRLSARCPGARSGAERRQRCVMPAAGRATYGVPAAALARRGRQR
eukprot:11152476-Heterocapsa_arctica.AAC.2